MTLLTLNSSPTHKKNNCSLKIFINIILVNNQSYEETLVKTISMKNDTTIDQNMKNERTKEQTANER